MKFHQNLFIHSWVARCKQTAGRSNFNTRSTGFRMHLKLTRNIYFSSIFSLRTKLSAHETKVALIMRLLLGIGGGRKFTNILNLTSVAWKFSNWSTVTLNLQRNQKIRQCIYIYKNNTFAYLRRPEVSSVTANQSPTTPVTSVPNCLPLIGLQLRYRCCI